MPLSLSQECQRSGKSLGAGEDRRKALGQHPLHIWPIMLQERVLVMGTLLGRAYGGLLWISLRSS